MTLEELIAIEEIRRLKARYFRLLDRKEWAQWKELFVRDLHVEINEPGTTLRLDGRDEFVAGTSSVLADIVTVHHGHMPEITLDGPDRAHGTWAMEDQLSPSPRGDGDLYHGKGWYEETYQRGADGRWRIASLALIRQWVAVDGRQIHPRRGA